MKYITAAGKSFPQGWDDGNASYDERPGMVSGFTYDYWLDSTEVTQGQYYAVTGNRPVDSGSSYGFGDNYPVYRVSWFDAVLYCNARSKLEQSDTVYTYSGVKALPNGTVYELTGLGYDLRRNGYRLPTESEWEYAARGASSALPYRTAADSAFAGTCAWYANNSSGTTHPVASRLPNALGLYDMGGNVFEWTNDWKCMYTGQGITNSLGSLHPGNEYEKVIKGGSYNYSLMHLRPSRRSATYATILASANEYVGFRCARGVISKGEHIGRETSFQPNPVTIMTNSSELRSFLWMFECRLVFVNVTGSSHTLCYVDFGRTFPYVAEYFDDRNVYHPVISPDGRYVAYCSRNEGQSGDSKVSIRSLDSLNSPIEQLETDTAYIPRWWVNRVTGDTCIVYTNSGMENGNPLWGLTSTYRQVIKGGKPEGLREVLIGNGSYHDGVSAGGSYAVTGFTRLLRRALPAGSDRRMFVSPENGKDAEGSTQVCNVSMSPDSGDSVRCMFLDFGYPRTSTVTGGRYGVHEYLFVSDMQGRITNYMRCPSGEESWDGVEWTNQARFGAGCGRDASNQSHAVYVIDLEGKESKQLVTGTELRQPYLWITGAMPYNDSLGAYNDPPGDYHQATKFLMFWHVFDSLEVAVTGSSLALFGVNPEMFTDCTIFNFAAMAFDPVSQKNLILHYLIKHCPDIKLICSTLDMCLLDDPDGNWTWKSYIGQSKGYRYDSCHDFWSSGISNEFRDIVCQIPLPNPADSINRGFWNMPSTGWGANPPPVEGQYTWTTADTFYQRNLATIIMLADTLRAKRIHWIMINFPISPGYQITGAYGLHGPSWQTGLDILQDVRDIEASNQYFHLYDANSEGNHDYGDEDAFDEVHLSGTGADKLTGRLAAFVDSIFNR